MQVMQYLHDHGGSLQPKGTLAIHTATTGATALLLTINNGINTPPQTVNACSTYTAPWGTVYNQSGTYSNTYTATNGCDSIVTINLNLATAPAVTLTTLPDTCGREEGTATVTVNGNNGPYSYMATGRNTIKFSRNNDCIDNNGDKTTKSISPPPSHLPKSSVRGRSHLREWSTRLAGHLLGT